jgi:dipeptidyl aminopeptidase/acylaminoacyl peptidase
MTSHLSSSLLPRIFFPVLLAILLTWLHAVAADRAISIPVQITHAQNFDPFPSPDGKKLVFISMISGKEQLFTMDADSSNVAQLTYDDADHEDPAWSPDGTRIAFVLITKDHHSIAVMRTDGSNVEVLTPREQNTIHPNWSADSKRVIYCTNDDLEPPKKKFGRHQRSRSRHEENHAAYHRRDQYLWFVVARYETYCVPQNHWGGELGGLCCRWRWLERPQPYEQPILRRLAGMVA